MKHNHEFKQLSQLIFEATHERISTTTLKRMWGYITDRQSEPRVTTLDATAKLAGFGSYEQFKQMGGGVIFSKQEEPHSEMFFSNGCDCAQLAPNEEIIITWQPNRRCRIRHIKEYRFEVVEVENAKLCVGDTFDCPCIINGEKLIVDNLCHKGITGLSYLAGKQGGVFFERVKDNKKTK